MKSMLPWKILHLDLSQPIPLLLQEAEYEGVYLVIWWRSVPLGRLEISVDRLPMPASQLLNLALQTVTPTVAAQLSFHDQQNNGSELEASALSLQTLNFSTLTALQSPLKKLEDYWIRHIAQAGKTVSVVICTRDRPEQLVKTLQSLQQLSHPPHEILVVDNAPNSDKTRQLVTHMAGVRYILEPFPGLSFARNSGIRHSTGEIIAFTDDDVTVHPDWLIHLSHSFNNPCVMAVTGLVLPEELETESQVIFELGHGCLSGNYRSRVFDTAFFEQNRAIGVPVWQIGAGANMAFRHQLFQLAKNFDQRLGAGAAGCSEDSELWYRILAQGWLCLYEPAAVVYHTHRRDLPCLQSQLYQYMRGHVVALLIQFAEHRHWGNLYRLIVALPRYCLGCLILGLVTGFRGKYRTAIAETLGCLAGVLFYLRHCMIPATHTIVTNEDCPESITSSSVSEFASTLQKR